jgi:hypothetical protein
MLKIDTKDKPGLCASCKYCQVIYMQNEMRVFCQALPSENRMIPRAVTNCNSYMDKNLPYKHELEDMAWILRTNEKAVKIGFKMEIAREVKFESPEDRRNKPNETATPK